MGLWQQEGPDGKPLGTNNHGYIASGGRCAFCRTTDLSSRGYEEGSGRACTHVDQIGDVAPNSEGCEQCVAVGDMWVHPRTRMTCGRVGCCDSSKNRHAHRHADGVGHPIARSKEPGEDWMWCYADDALVRAEVP